MDVAEHAYRAGVERWAARDLEAADELLHQALADAGSIDHTWWFAISRALAAIAIERGAFANAAHHLRRLPDSAVGTAQQCALRARLSLYQGDDHGAMIHASAGFEVLLDSPLPDEPSELMNGALAALWFAEVLAEVGCGHEAQQLLAVVEALVAQAGVDDPGIAEVAGAVEASAYRLLGDGDAALETILGLEPAADADVSARLVRERARLAWQRDDRARADALYQQAAAMFTASNHPTDAARVEAERTSGPPPLRDDPDPLERWATRELEEALAEIDDRDS